MELPRRIPKKRNKSDRWRSTAHCDFVRSHECVVPGCTRRPIEVAHVRIGSDAGMGRKPSDYFTVSMCGGVEGHHSESHRIGEASFQKKYGIDLHKLAASFAAVSPRAQQIRRAKAERMEHA
jgi:hypothetical protein